MDKESKNHIAIPTPHSARGPLKKKIIKKKNHRDAFSPVGYDDVFSTHEKNHMDVFSPVGHDDVIPMRIIVVSSARRDGGQSTAKA
jgi:hypothetical protein